MCQKDSQNKVEPFWLFNIIIIILWSSTKRGIWESYEKEQQMSNYDK